MVYGQRIKSMVLKYWKLNNNKRKQIRKRDEDVKEEEEESSNIRCNIKEVESDKEGS